MKRAIQFTALGLALLLCAGIAAPYFGAGQYRGHIRAALEKALDRKVTVGEIHYTLLTGPGFTISNVVIEDDPSLGAEPFAYVTTLKAIPRLWSLWSGHLEFASLRLDDAYLNLLRTQAPDGRVRWNFEPLLRPGVLAAFPSIVVRGGRIYFKSGNTKSIFYLLNTDLDISPPSLSGGDWRVRIEAQPARTDRPARRGFGSFLASGRWRPPFGPAAGQTGGVNLDVTLDHNELSDLITLVNGQDSGLHGSISGRAHLAGPLNGVGIDGRVSIEGLHRWDQTPPAGVQWPLILSGRLDSVGRRADLSAHLPARRAQDPALVLHYRVVGYLSQPRWGVQMSFAHFPVEPLLPLARHMGVAVPGNLQLAGTIDGAVGYSGEGTLQGGAGFHNTAILIGSSPPLRFEDSQMVFNGDVATLVPTTIRGVQNDVAQIQADYHLRSQALNIALTTDGMQIASLRSHAELGAVPMLAQMTAGTWRGGLKYEQHPGEPAAWTGKVQLSGVELPFPAFSEAVRLDSAQADIDGERVSVQKIRAHLGSLNVEGEYRYDPKETRPHHFRLTMDKAAGDEIEDALLPVLKHQASLLTRALSLGRASTPEWMRDWHADGVVQIGTLQLGDFAFERFRSRIIWDGVRASLTDLQANTLRGGVAAHVDVDLRESLPIYHLVTRFAAINWKGGKLTAETASDTSGIGRQTLANLRSEGSFTARSVDLAPLEEFNRISGCYEFASSGGIAHVKLTGLQLSNGSETFIGSGGTQDDGQIVLQLSNGSRDLSLAATLANGGTFRALP